MGFRLCTGKILLYRVGKFAKYIYRGKKSYTIFIEACQFNFPCCTLESLVYPCSQTPISLYGSSIIWGRRHGHDRAGRSLGTIFDPCRDGRVLRRAANSTGPGRSLRHSGSFTQTARSADSALTICRQP